jgi:hypothetical protein
MKKIKLEGAREERKTPASSYAAIMIMQDGLPFNPQSIRSFVPVNLKSPVLGGDPVLLYFDGGGEDEYRGYALIRSSIPGELFRRYVRMEAVGYLCAPNIHHQGKLRLDPISEEEAQEWVHFHNALLRMKGEG